MRDDEFSFTDPQETDHFTAPRKGRPLTKKLVVGPTMQPLHLRPAMKGYTIYVPKDATMGPHKVDVPKRTSDTVMW